MGYKTRPDATRKITVTDVATYPQPGTAAPTKPAFSPDDKVVTYLASAAASSLRQQLYAYDIASGDHYTVLRPDDMTDGAETLSLEERLRRERTRTRAGGVTDYAWAEGTPRLLVPLAGAVYVKDDLASPPRQLVDAADGPAIDPQWSPDGEMIAFVRRSELHVVSRHGGDARQLTHGAGEEGVTHGLAEYVAQEEMGRAHGFWWSPDSRRLAFVEVDERHIPAYTIVHQGEPKLTGDAQETHRYPFAGAANAKVRLGVVSLDGGAPVSMDLGDDDIYLARVDWAPAGDLLVQMENREQTELRLIRFDLVTGAATELLRETNETWINLHDMLKPLDDGRFIWASERSGFMHLYLYDRDGHLLHPITRGDWMVDDLVSVDEARGVIYVTGTHASPLECQLYEVPLAGGDLRRLTPEPGMHAVVMDHAHQRFIDVHSDLTQPPRITLRSVASGEILSTLHQTEDERVAALGLVPPDLATFEGRDGAVLYAALYRPPESDYGRGPYPVIVSVYGGPHAQRVKRDWSLTADMRAQYLASLGFLVLKVDNRGSARRGLAFEGAIKGNLGDLEVRDQVDGVRWAVQRELADPERVGVVGWSYGGYMAAMCLARAPEVFKVAVAGAPVTHWDGYDTHYTERYMGHPEANPTGYDVSSVLAHVAQIEGKLLLVHGLIDENVHFRHTARLINALIKAQKPYDLLLFPGERHMPRDLEGRIYMESRLRDYFLAYL